MTLFENNCFLRQSINYELFNIKKISFEYV